MKNFKIGMKLIVAFGTILVFFCITVSTGIIGMRVLSDDLSHFYSESHQVVKTTIEMRRDLQEGERLLINSFFVEDTTKAQQKLDDCAEVLTRMRDSVPVLTEKFTGDKQLLEDFQLILDSGAATRMEIFDLVRANDQKAAINLYDSEYDAVIVSAREVLNEISDIAEQDATDFYENGVEAQMIALVVLIAVSAVSLIAIIFFFIYIVRSLTKPIKEIEAAANKMASGQLDGQIEYTSRDELGGLAQSMRAMMQTLQGYIGNISETLHSMSQGDMTVDVDMDYIGDFAPIKQALERIISSLNATLSQINQASEQVASGSDQVSSGAQELSQGSTEQASSIEELSATVSEISEQIRQNAGNAQQSKQMAMETGSAIELGNRQMEQLIGAMSEISSSSDQIGKIIKTIDDIAFQTNILALNAAVEAARAGAAGKGFAVVADEVRSLAAKSADAAKNTTELIAGSITAVKNGSAISADTAKSLDSVMEKAQGTIRLVDEIAKASNEQANAVIQITQGIDQISMVIQTNSATAEESAAASEELNGQAQVLRELVEQFNLKDDSITETIDE
ncbi:MAG: methyl-accepting chemotaxis protein [Acetanaerobacterium sp.]